MNVVAVTGAGGMIGRHLLEALKSTAGEVRVLLLPSEPVPDSFENAVVYRGDLRKPEELRAFIDGADTVFHLAALVGKDANDAAAAQAVNVEGTRNLVELSKVHGVRRFVYLSTCCVYGLHGLDEEIVDETARHAPLDHPYDITKTKAEELVAGEDPTRLPWSVLQVPVVLGGPQTVTKPNLMAHIRVARSGFVPHTVGDRSWANYVYAGDVAAALRDLGTHPLAVGEAFICSETMTLNDLFGQIAKELAINVRRVPLPGFALRAASRAHSRLAILANRRRFSSEKLRSRLNFSPKVGLEEGLRLTISHYRKAGLA